jgi:hypothetical protein
MPLPNDHPPIQSFRRASCSGSVSSSSTSAVTHQGARSSSNATAIGTNGDISVSSETIFTPGATSASSHASASTAEEDVTTQSTVQTSSQT